ncbi:MAG: hypothetical protein AAGL66_02335 [Pseudomonadota bacterium]
MSLIAEEIEARLRRLLADLAAGDDAPPADRLRLEGLCEAAVLTGELASRDLDVLLERLHSEYFDTSLSASLGADWRVYHPFPQLPLYMRRAPVSPSTPE